MNQWMALALECGKKSIGISRPNPAVGAVVVKNGTVCAIGQTQSPGKAHAEVMALQTAAENAKGADLYVTLEPCCHYGRTPPCTQAIIDAGIKRVFFAHSDPNPKVQGNSRKILEAAGIEVYEGLEACSQNKNLYSKIEHYFEGYDYFVKCGKPLIELKIAKTQDGFIAQKNYNPLKITHDKANEWNHTLRSISDSILIGASTACKDNPRLDVRLVEGNSPLKIIFGQTRKLPSTLQLFSDQKTIIFSSVPQPEIESKAEIILLPSKNFVENWNFVIQHLAKMGMHRVMVEPGKNLFHLLIENNLWNNLYLWKSSIFAKEGISISPLNYTPSEIIPFNEDTLYIYRANSI